MRRLKGRLREVLASLDMFLVVSFDFGGTSAVKIHCATPSENVGRSMFAAMSDRHRDENEKRLASGAGSLLIDLVEVPNEYSSSDGHTLFWGSEKVA